jgi:hypothetical protein
MCCTYAKSMLPVPVRLCVQNGEKQTLERTFKCSKKCVCACVHTCAHLCFSAWSACPLMHTHVHMCAHTKNDQK